MTRREAITNAAALAGIGISIPLLSISLGSCKTEPVDQLDVLAPKQAAILKSISATLLPKGETLGAEDVEINKVVDVLLRDCAESEDKTNVLSLLDHLSTQVGSDGDMNALLKGIESEVYGGGNDVTEHKAYKGLKGMILFAFFTSEPVMESMLDYHAVPTKYVGCTEVTEDTRVYVDLNV